MTFLAKKYHFGNITDMIYLKKIIGIYETIHFRPNRNQVVLFD